MLRRQKHALSQTATPTRAPCLSALNRKPEIAAFHWVLPEDYCKKDPCNFNAEMFVSKVGNPCPTLGQLLASRILYALFAGEKPDEIARARFCTQNCSKVGQLLVNSSPTPPPVGRCKGLPCSSPLATPDFSAQIRFAQLHCVCESLNDSDRAG